MNNGKPVDGASPDIFTFEEARRYLRLPEKKFRKIVKRGEIYYRREGRTMRFTRRHLDAWANGQRNACSEITCDSCPFASVDGHSPSLTAVDGRLPSLTAAHGKFRFDDQDAAR